MQTFVLTAEVIMPDQLASIFVVSEEPTSWEVDFTPVPGDEHFDSTVAFGKLVDRLFFQDRVTTAGIGGFSLGEAFKVRKSTYEFWFTYRPHEEDDAVPDLVNQLAGNHEWTEMYFAGIQRSDPLGRVIYDATHAGTQLDIEDDALLSLLEGWSGVFKIVLTSKKKS